MGGSESASLSRQQGADLRDLKRINRGARGVWGALVVCGTALLLTWFLFLGGLPGGTEGIRAGPSLQSEWVVAYLEREQSLFNFLWYLGLPPERWAFSAASDLILSSGADLSATRESSSTWRLFVLAGHRGLLHLVFVLLVCWRAWIAYLLWVWVTKLIDRGVYQGDNLLGQMGNGRLFYSGARAGLFNVADNGAPDVQVRGLACPPEAAADAVLNSPLYQVLERHGAVSETNKGLISYLLADPRIPAFASGMNQDRVVERIFEGCSLAEIAEVALEHALYLHGHYIDGTYDDDSFYGVEESGSEKAEITVEQYATRLLTGFHRVLTDSMRDAMAKFSAAQVATIVLSLHTGKVLAYSFEGGRWIRTSSFPELCARSVLHSVVAYGRELSFYEREYVRQALIYGSRFSLMGPIRLPVAMSLQARAARQWVELMMAEPHELAASIDEVELVGIIAEVHAEWSARLSDSLQRGESTVFQGTCVGPSEVVFMPVQNLLAQMREILPREWIERIGELVSLVSQKQKLVMMSAELNAEGAEAKSIPAYQRLLPPLSFAERKMLVDEFQLSPEDVRDWCALRGVFNAHGWLARRVGSRSVPESSIIFCVVRIDHDHFPVNEKGRAGLEAVVPLRGSRLEARLGRGWASLFPEASTAKLALTREEYELFLAGKKRPSSNEDEGEGGVDEDEGPIGEEGAGGRL